MHGLKLVGWTFALLGDNGLKLLRTNWFQLLVLALLLTGSWLFLAKRDQIVPLPFDHPLLPFLDIAIVNATTFLKLIVIGTVVPSILTLLEGEPLKRKRTGLARFLLHWCLISIVFVGAILSINAIQLQFEFGGSEPLSPVATIAVKLLALYLQYVVLWVAVYFFVVAPHMLYPTESNTGWRFASGQKVGVVVGATIIFLVTESLLSTLIFYSPPVAPFWFGLNQLDSGWTILVQCVTVTAETLAAMVYACFIAVAYQSIADVKRASS